jgi:hypothetical protein
MLLSVSTEPGIAAMLVAVQRVGEAFGADDHRGEVAEAEEIAGSLM